MANLDLVISFDTTGSMSGVIGEVKKNVKELTSRLVADISNIRVAIIAHGDYGDTPYVTKIQNFTNDNHILDDFITNVESTSGGDFEECYELVLREVRTKLSWRTDSRKRLIMIGDATPHELNSPRNKHKIDWKKEVAQLKNELHLSIYAVKAYEGNNLAATQFWHDLAELSGGTYLSLQDFSSIFAILLGICYHEHGVEALDAFEVEMRAKRTVAPDVDGMFTALRRTASGATVSSVITSPVSAGAATKRKRLTATRRKTASGATLSSVITSPVSAGAATKRKRSTATATGTVAPSAAAPPPVKKRRTVATEKKTLEEERKKRESVATRHFMKDSSRWSKWMLAATAQKMTLHPCWSRTEDGVSWRSRIPLGYHFKSSTSGEVFHYELAVQCGLGGRRVPVFSTFEKHTSQAEAEGVMKIWMRQSRFEALRRQIKRVTQKGLRVFMRRSRKTLSSSLQVKDLQTKLQKQFSYAWNSGRPLRVGAASVSYRGEGQN